MNGNYEEHGPPDLYPYRRPLAEFWLSGRLDEGGKAELREGEWSVQIQFAAIEFAVLVVLVEAALEETHTEDWGPRGFLKAAEIRQAIVKRSLGAPDLKQVTKTIWRIREKIREGVGRVAPRSVDPHAWSMAILEYDVGYRISVPPQRVHLAV